MQYSSKNHTFVICAYKENKYLSNCVESLLNQTIPSKVIMCTSTPNDHIMNIAQKYNVELFVNTNKSSLSGDWNFAIDSVQTDIFTICHQDDYYFPNYLEEVINNMNKVENPIFVYTNYYEDKKGNLEKSNINMKIKNILNFPLKFKATWNNKFIRRRILSLGNPICCPSVTYVKKHLEKDFFDVNFKNAADWDAWERLSKLDGAVIYCSNHLMAHRIYEESTTTLNIQDNTRSKEDFIIFSRFWPKSIAKIITKIFKLSEINNN